MADEAAAKQLFARTGITLGETLGDRYQIVEILGQGGMGTVFKAINLTLNKPVAVKALHMYLDKFAAMRFQQEIKAMSMLSHPHLISVLDAGTTAGGTPYFVMEFLDGPALGDLLAKQGPPPDVRAIRMFIQMADALAYAHERGVIHRDLKPNNVVVLSNRGKDFIKLVDLGIAKLMDPPTGERQGLTMTGEIFGSPIYMSPEQCSGKQIDERSDIYSLGCMMFETICGEPPIKGGSALETFNLHMTLEAPLISTMSAVRMTPSLRALEPIIARCIRILSEDRFQTMEELSQALEYIDRNSNTDIVSNLSSSTAKVSADKPIAFASAEQDAVRTHAFNEVGEAANGYQQVRREREFKKESNSAVKVLMPGIIGFVLVFCGVLMVAQVLFHRKPPDTVPAPALVQNSSPYQNSEVLQKTLKEIASRQLSQHSTVSYPESKSSNSRVEVVAVYMGKNQEAGNVKLPGNVEVDVKYSEKPITLVLVSYMPTNWKIMRDGPAVKIARVLVSSYQAPITVEGVPAGVPVEKAWYPYFAEDGQRSTVARKNPFELFVMSSALIPNTQNVESSSDFQKMKKVVEAHLHEPIKSFQGAYSEERFTVE